MPKDKHKQVFTSMSDSPAPPLPPPCTPPYSIHGHSNAIYHAADGFGCKTTLSSNQIKLLQYSTFDALSMTNHASNISSLCLMALTIKVQDIHTPHLKNEMLTPHISSMKPSLELKVAMFRWRNCHESKDEDSNELGSYV
jgi:hypothetical protein